jgi:hypothetical protein
LQTGPAHIRCLPPGSQLGNLLLLQGCGHQSVLLLLLESRGDQGVLLQLLLQELLLHAGEQDILLLLELQGDELLLSLGKQLIVLLGRARQHQVPLHRDQRTSLQLGHHSPALKHGRSGATLLTAPALCLGLLIADQQCHRHGKRDRERGACLPEAHVVSSG